MTLSARHKALAAYLVLLHGLVLLMALKSNFLERLYLRLGGREAPVERQESDEVGHELLQRISRSSPENAVHFFGDSHLARVEVSRLVAKSAHLAIGEDTAAKLATRIHSYRSLPGASAVVLAIGQNDLFYRSPEATLEHIQRITSSVPSGTPLFLSQVLPVDEKRAPPEKTNAGISGLNSLIEEHCKAREHCRFLRLEEDFAQRQVFQPDGVHLNEQGRKQWTTMLVNGLRSEGIVL